MRVVPGVVLKVGPMVVPRVVLRVVPGMVLRVVRGMVLGSCLSSHRPTVVPQGGALHGATLLAPPMLSAHYSI